MIWLFLLVWFGFLAWLGLTTQGRDFGEYFWAWINPWDYTKGIIDGKTKRKEETEQALRDEDAKRVLEEAETRRKAHNKNVAAMRGSDGGAGIGGLLGMVSGMTTIAAGRAGAQLRVETHQDIRTNERKFKVVDPETKKTVIVSIRPEELALRTAQDASHYVQTKICEALRDLRGPAPVDPGVTLGEVSGGVAVTPEEYEKKFAPDGVKPMSPEDHLIQDILNACPQDYHDSDKRVAAMKADVEKQMQEAKDAEFEAGH